MKTMIMTVLMLVSGMAYAGRAEDNKALFDAAAAQQLELAKIDAAALQAKAAEDAKADTAAVTACASAKDPSACVLAVQMASMVRAVMAGQSIQQRQNLPIPYRRDMGAIFKDMMTPMVPIMGQVAGGMERVRLAESSERLQVQQYQTFGGIATTAITANAQVSAAAVAGAQPSYTIGGDMIGGDRVETNIGDDYTGGDRSEVAVGGDQVGRDQRIGDDVGRDQIGGDRVDNQGIIGDYNEQRIESPGPIDNSDNGDCDGSGDSCNDGGGP